MRGGATMGGKYCAPGKQSNGHSCYDNQTLLQMAHTVKQQKNETVHDLHDLSTEELWREVDQHLNQECDSERCWARHLGVNEQDYFRPTMPVEWKQNTTSWLSNHDILKVLKQYEKQYSDFVFLGPSPVDFDTQTNDGQCVENSLCSLDLKQMIRRKKFRIGIVFNLDRHDEPGSHWVSMYVNILDGHVYYYDSYGFPPPPEIYTLMERLSHQGTDIQAGNSSLGTPFKAEFNQHRHQYKNSECGMYSLYFITSMLEKNDFQQFISNGLPDNVMNKYRQYFFDPNTN